MTYNYKISLSICHGFQIAYFMGQQFSIALIIEFVETDNYNETMVDIHTLMISYMHVGVKLVFGRIFSFFSLI